MEATTVSPSPASPTEGENLCEIDVTNVAIHSVALLICLCGLAGNGAVLWLLSSPHVSRNSTTRYILILTFFDFLLLLHLVPSSLLFLQEDVSCSVIMPLLYVWLVFQLSLMYSSLGLYLLTAINIRRCRSIHCPIWHCCHRPQHLSKVVCAVIWAFSITVIALFTAVIFLCASQLPEHCRMSLISMYAFNLLLCAPFTLISSAILFIKDKSGSHQQQPKRLNIVICVILLFTLPLSLWKFLQEFGYTIFTSQEAFLLICIQSSIKPFIYFLAGSCWRHCSMGSLRLSLQRIFEEPEENPADIDDPAMEAVL
ncbi:PREDICTED: mas-related G-protein coupled receptor member H-like [Ficedula albicollis]|uniref:mas-related G-protein coupled receptor member H-like n=1 Tax=Ficedula albicollis TaxID=59894 RepID=UPI00035A0B2C|nr:PREDICTED: mas-related G-protein coupled receptor member H-like [Ficedula albicollis]XP_005042616.1 PREDICTED: mas-related G-protein coupled receptor member H-like [Ficedula albicollis]